jgi:hypothetical protein
MVILEAFRLCSVDFQFAAQTMYVDLKHMTLTKIFLSPPLLEQEILRHDAAHILRQICYDLLGKAKPIWSAHGVVRGQNPR